MSATAAARLEASTARPQPHPRSATPAAELSWDELADRVPQMAATMQAYLDQLTVSSRPGTVVAASLSLRHLAAHLADTDPTCTTVAAIERRHIESYKLALAARPGRRGNTKVSNQTIRHNLGMVRTFFERVIDWDYPDAPRRVPVFTGDLPKADEPTPKFLDDPTAAKFMATLATDSNRRRRLIVELLARTGMRAGELGALRDDAMYRLGDTHWLRIPLGKLHNDRSVPLHPLLVGLINDYRSWRGPTPTGLLVERDDHQPFDRRTIHRYVQAVAKRAGVGHVHPHQLRHTLATQCLNRGMSLEAIAALLGHRSPRMTLVYARIADTVVADQYFNATRTVEADTNTMTPSSNNHHDMNPTHHRLLGNGHCTRPVELDCRFQTICEACGFYETGPEFVTILRRQRDNATDHADTARATLYAELVRVIDDSNND
jgi:integrase